MRIILNTLGKILDGREGKEAIDPVTSRLEGMEELFAGA